MFSKNTKCLHLIRDHLKWGCAALRFLALNRLASLAFVSRENDKTHKKLLELKNSFVMESTIDRSYVQKDHIHPLFVPAGEDTIETIGDPKVFNKGDSFEQMWRDSYNVIFGEEASKEELDMFEIEKLLKEKYKESRIDSELENFE